MAMKEYICMDCRHKGKYKEVVLECGKCKSRWIIRAKEMVKKFEKELYRKDVEDL